MKRTRRIIPWMGIVAVGLGALTLLTTSNSPVTADAAVGIPTLVSAGTGTSPSLSGDGRYVVFQGPPATADGRTSTIWLRDQQSEVLTELSQPADGIRSGDSVLPRISADGCVVVMTTQMAFDLFRDDDRGTRWDVYRATLPACGGQLGDWELVSSVAGYDGQAAALGEADPTQTPAISSSGSVVAYVRPFRPLSGLPSAQNSQSAIEVVDFSVPIDQPGRSTTAAGMPATAPDAAQLYLGQQQPVLSGDGAFVVFTSDATSDQAVPDWVPPLAADQAPLRQVFAWDRNNLDPFTNVKLISAAAAGGAANADAESPSVSTDGRFIAFTSSATNLVTTTDFTACGLSCPTQVYRVDRDGDNNFVFDEPTTVITALVSSVPAPPPADATLRVAGNGASLSPSLSSDGNTVAFSTQADNLMDSQVPGLGEVGDGDLLLADLDAGVLRRAFARAELLPGAHAHPALSANGRVLVTDSLVAGAMVGRAEVTGRQVLSAMFIPTVLLAPLNVGTVTVGVPGQEWFLNVLNDGPGSFTPAKVESNNPDFAVTGGSCFDKAAVPAGGSCSVKVMLTPSVAGPLTGTLTVAEAGYGALTLTAELSGSGGEPALEAQPAGADLGSAIVGQVAGRVVISVGNVSLGPTTVASVVMSGVDPQDFAVIRNDCVVELPLGAKCEVEFEFTPSGSGRRSATAVIGTATGQYTSVLLSGEGQYNAALLAKGGAKAGSRLPVGGMGFPADTPVTIGFSDGTGRSVTVTTDHNGAFVTTLLITKGQRAGRQTLLAQAADGTSASSAIVIERSKEIGPGSAAWTNP